MCDNDDLGLSMKNWKYFRKTHLVSTLNQIRTQHVNMILYPANIWMEEIRYHPARSSVCRSARGGITDAIAMGSMAKLTSWLTLFRGLFAVVGWNPVLAMLIVVVVAVQELEAGGYTEILIYYL